MNVEEIREYALAKPSVTEEFPFDDKHLVFKVGNSDKSKIFLLINIENYPLFFNVKTNPEWSEVLREQYTQIIAGYHMNKKHWNSVYCDGLPKKLLQKLIDQSYDLVLKSLPKKVKEEMI